MVLLKLMVKYFTYEYDDKSMFNEKLGQLFEIPNRLPEEELTQDHKDMMVQVYNRYMKNYFLIYSMYYMNNHNQIVYV